MAKYLNNEAVKSLMESTTVVDENYATELLQKDWISKDDLLELLRAESKTNTLKILQELEYYIPKKVAAPQSKDFKKSMRKLQILQEEKEYQSLLGKDYDPEITLTPSQMSKQVKEQLTTIVNVFVTAGSVGFAVWYWTRSSMSVSVTTRVFLSLAFGLLVLIAEVVVYNGYLRRVEEAKAKELKIKEKKRLVERLL